MKTNYIPNELPKRTTLEKNFSTNINPLGPPTWVFEHLAKGLDEITFYPELWHQSCDKVIADIWNTDSMCHLAIPGTSQFLFSLPFILNLEIKKAKWVSCTPSFWEYSLVAKINNINFVEYALNLQEQNHETILQDFISFIEIEQPDVLFICTPNNPTGHSFSPDFIEKLTKLFPQMLIVVDLTYAFFEPEFERYLNLFKNHERKLIGVLSYSKFFCLPGLRIGSVFFSDPLLTSQAQSMMGPLRLSSLAESILPLLLQDTDYIQSSRDFFKSEWIFFENELIKRDMTWLRPTPSNTCFKLVFLDHSKNSSELNGAILSKQLYDEYGLRICSGETYGIPNAIRLRIGLRKSNMELIAALQNCYNSPPNYNMSTTGK